MSLSRGNSQELLMRGLAAAQSGNPKDHEEAEYYLEWVLRTDSDLDQQVQAWYWLSRISDDHARRHECLENALAIKPGHADARRDLAILEGRLKPDNMRADPLQSGTAVVPNAQVAAGEVKRFKCPKCGASVVYNPGMAALDCQFCGTRIDAQGQVVEAVATGASGNGGEVSEQDWVAAIYTEQGHKWALPQSRVLKCEGCGATVTFSPARVSTRCLYCASPYTAQVVAPDMGDLREPDGVVLFRFDAHAVMAYARWWLGEQSKYVGVPGDLQTLAAMQTPTPIYLPFWTFDIAGEVRWKGWIREDASIAGVNVDMNSAFGLGGIAAGLLMGSADMAARSAADMIAKRAEGDSNLVYAEGAVGVIQSNTIVPATKSLPIQVLEKLSYNVQEAIAYNEDMLAHWPAEVYSVSMADASLTARGRAVKHADEQIALETGGLTGKPVQSIQLDRTGLSVLSYKLLLLPVWTLDYTYRDGAYRLLVNGQNGLSEGDVPGGLNALKKLFRG